MNVRSDPPISQSGKRLWVPFAVQNGLDDFAAGHPRDGGDDLGQLDIHLFQSFLHVLNMAGGVADLHLTLAMVAAQSHDRIRRPK